MTPHEATAGPRASPATVRPPVRRVTDGMPMASASALAWGRASGDTPVVVSLLRTARRALLALAAAFALASPAEAQAAAQAAQASAPPTGRVRVDTLWSNALRTRKQFVVYLPASYDREPARRYP